MSVIISDTANIFTLGKKDASPAQTVSFDTVFSGTVKAWAYFSTDGSVSGSTFFNVSSTTDGGTGDYQNDFTNTLTTGPFPVVATVRSGIANDRLAMTNSLTTQVDINIYDVSSVAAIDEDGYWILTGDYA